MKGINKAVKAVGSNNKLANLLQVDRQLVDYWIKTGRPSPIHCSKISELTGVSLSELRPDVYKKS